MTVELPDHLGDFVRQRIAAGEFVSADQVVCAGLKLLQERESWKRDIQHEIDRGWDQAAGGQLLSLEEARENLAALKGSWSQSRKK